MIWLVLRRLEILRPRLAGFSQPALWLLIALLCGCASTSSPPQTSRRFEFQKDTFSYPNQLVWEYYFDTNGEWTSKRRVPPPTYSHHCFVLARSTRQFFVNARFAPDLPVANEAVYRRLIRNVVSSNPRYPLPDQDKIIIPGYANLREFSQAWESLLKQESGGAWQSYFQRGHWRMIWRFSRDHQDAMARQLLTEVGENPPVVVHVVRFPSLLINHALVIYDAEQTQQTIRFITYDPNHPVEPIVIEFNRADRTFRLPANDYFPGGRIDVYEVYHKWDY